MLYLIEILHQTTTMFVVTRLLFRCILSKFYIKPQPFAFALKRTSGCILSKFYIKPQLLSPSETRYGVVSYRNSTSNHNTTILRSVSITLYLIEILHQTTTCGKCEDCLRRLYLIEILHQTTTRRPSRLRFSCCILSKFYIKPQL